MPKNGSSSAASCKLSAKETAKMKSAQVEKGRGSDSSAADGSFVPTVTAVATAPDLKWMVLSTDISSVRPCGGGKQRKAQGPLGKEAPSAPRASHGAPAARRKAQKEELSPEEEERRRVRRERNKLAAAKCRNRRRELTDSLQAETDSLEEEKAALQAEISSLLKEKEQLELLLSDHKPHCKIPADMEEDEEEEDISNASPQKPPPELPEDQNPVEAPPSPVDLDKMPSSPLTLHQVPTCPQELEAPCPIISGDSDVLLCSSATLEPYIDLKDVPMDDLGSKMEEEDDDMDLLVPDIDLTSSLGLTEWETLYMSMGGSLDPLSPACGGISDGGVPSGFDFPCADGEGCEDTKEGPGKAKAGSDNSKLLVL